MTELELAAMVFADSFKLSKLYLPEDFKTAFVESFEAGAEWQAKQSPWKITANEPPPEYTDVLLSAGSRPDIFVGYFNGEDFRIRSTEETIEYFRVLHWMPIPE